MKPDVEFHTCRKSLMDGRRPLFTCVYAVHGLWEATKPFETAGPLQCCLGVLRAGIAGIAGIAGLTIGLLRHLARQLQERHRKTWKNQERCEKMCRLKMIQDDYLIQDDSKSTLLQLSLSSHSSLERSLPTFPDISLPVHKAFVMPHARFTQAIQRWKSQLERLPRSSLKNLYRENVSQRFTSCSVFCSCVTSV